MRLSRNTLLLLLASLVVIAAVFLLNREDAQDPAVATPVVQDEGGPLLPDLREADIARVALRENESGHYLQLTRADAAWTIDGPLDAEQRTVDQAAAQQAVADLLALAVNSSFEIDDPGAFGLDAPAFTIEVDRGEGPLELIFIGNENPQGTRFLRHDAATGGRCRPARPILRRATLCCWSTAAPWTRSSTCSTTRPSSHCRPRHPCPRPRSTR